MEGASVYSLYRWGNWGTEKSDNSKVPWLASGRARIGKSSLTLALNKASFLVSLSYWGGPFLPPVLSPEKRPRGLWPMAVFSRFVLWDLLEGALKINNKWRQREKKYNCVTFNCRGRPKSTELGRGGAGGGSSAGRSHPTPQASGSEAAKRGCWCSPHLLSAGFVK